MKMTKKPTYHDAVMLKESTEGLDIKADGTYVDVTYGGGGHSHEILQHLESGKLYAFDQDPDSEERREKNDNLVFINQNFKYLSNFLRMHSAIPADGLLADLGVSSHQFNTDVRGFSFRFDGPLDMRMNKEGDLSAARIIADYDEEQLSRLLREYGELKNAKKVARKIVECRSREKIDTTFKLVDCIESLTPSRHRNKFLAQVFQALRIEVNGEMDALKDLLNQCTEAIKENGRIVFITYHSLEDRLVKNFIKSGNFKGDIKKDFFGNVMKPFEAVNRKVILPSDEEIERNNRARSAKLRIAKRLKAVD